MTIVVSWFNTVLGLLGWGNSQWGNDQWGD